MNRTKTLHRAAGLLIALGLVSQALGSERNDYPLIKAAQGGDAQLVKSLLARGEAVNEDDRGITALHVAARGGHEEIVKLLLSHGASVDRTKYGRIAPLFYAVMSGRESDVFPFKLLSHSGLSKETVESSDTQKRFRDIVELLIDHGADVNAIEYECRFVPLQYAALGGNIEVVKALLDHDAQVNPVPKVAELYWQMHGSPLHLAARNGDLAMCEVLIGRGANVNSKTPVWTSMSLEAAQTPLHHAVCYGSVKVVESLIKHGAEVNARSTQGQTPLHVVTKRTDRSIVEMLLAHGADVNAIDSEGKTPLHRAAERADASIAEAFLSRGADANATERDGRTPLHFAAQRKDRAMAEALLSHGANPNPKSHDGQTPTSIATQNGSAEIVKLLATRHGQTTIHSAASTGDVETLERLVKGGVNINRLDIEGRAALHAAVVAGQVLVVEWLLAHGADPNCSDDKGVTPLSISLGIAQGFCFSEDPNEVARFNALKSRQKEILALLIARGATPDFSYGIPSKTVRSHPMEVADLLIEAGPNYEPYSDSKATILHRAASYADTRAMELLLAKGADPNAKADDGSTALLCLLSSDLLTRDKTKTAMKDFLIKLIRRGVRVDVQNSREVTPLQQAAALEFSDLLEELLSRGASVNAKSATGWTALHSAVASGNAAFVEILLKHKAEVNVPGYLPLNVPGIPRHRFEKSAVTPLQIATSQGDNRIIQLLLAAGADKDVPPAKRP